MWVCRRLRVGLHCARRHAEQLGEQLQHRRQILLAARRRLNPLAVQHDRCQDAAPKPVLKLAPGMKDMPVIAAMPPPGSTV